MLVFIHKHLRELTKYFELPGALWAPVLPNLLLIGVAN